MKRTQRNLLALALIAFGFTSSAFAAAEPVKGLKVVQLGGNTKTIDISWTAASGDTLEDADGYAIQFSDRSNNIRNDKSVKQYVPLSKTNLQVRFPMEANKTYYFRVYTYEEEGKNKYLSNGSAMLTQKVASNGTITESTNSVSDVTVTREVSADSSGSGDLNPTDENGNPITVGTLSQKKYDTWTILSWSRPNLASTVFDGFTIKIAKNADMKDPIAEVETGTGDRSLKLLELAPNTQYYAQGFFRKGSKLYGEGPKKSFKTDAAYSAAQQARLGRLIKQRLISDRADKTFKIGESSSTDSSSTDNSTDTTNNTTTTPKTTKPVTGGAVSGMSKAEIEKEILALNRRLIELKRQLSKLQGNKTTKRTTRRRTLPTRRRGRGPIVIPR